PAITPRARLHGVFSGARYRARRAPCGADDPRWRDRRARQRRATLVQRAAEPGTAEERGGNLRGAARESRGAGVLRSAALRGTQPALRTLLRPPSLPRAMPAAWSAPAAGACFRRRRAAVWRRTRAWLRGHHRQAPEQPLPGGSALGRLAEAEGGSVGRIPHGRLHARYRCARATRSVIARLPRGQSAALCRSRRLGTR